MGLPAFPSCYAHIASASGRVLPEAAGRFLLHEGNLPSSAALPASLGRGPSLHRLSRVTPLTYKPYEGDGKNKGFVGFHPPAFAGGLPPTKLNSGKSFRGGMKAKFSSSNFSC